MTPNPEVKVKAPEVKIVAPSPEIPVNLPFRLKESPKLWEPVEAPKPERNVKTRRPGKNRARDGNGEASWSPHPAPLRSTLPARRSFPGLGLDQEVGRALVPWKEPIAGLRNIGLYCLMSMTRREVTIVRP